jgi:ribonuclease III
VLGCAIAEELFRRFPQLSEGRLTRFRSALVRREALAEIAELLELRSHLRLGAAVQVSPAIIANALEALVGAIFIDGGYGVARDAVVRAYGKRLDELDPRAELKDDKSRLQEWMQAQGRPTPEYRLIRKHGPDNELSFEVSCIIAEPPLETRGVGPSMQKAQQQAARAMLERLKA